MVKCKLSPCSGSVAFRQLNPVHKKEQKQSRSSVKIFSILEHYIELGNRTTASSVKSIAGVTLSENVPGTVTVYMICLIYSFPFFSGIAISDTASCILW